MKRATFVLALLLCASNLSAQSPVLFSTVPLPLVEGTLVTLPNGQLALASAPGTYISVQPDGRIETRTEANAWEFASRAGDSVLRFDGAGTARYLFVVGLPSSKPPDRPDPPKPSGHHVGPGPLSADRARQVVMATAGEFPALTKVFDSDEAALSAATELLRRVVWHLQLAGFQAARQRNPSGLISGDKLCIVIDGNWQAYDISSLGYAGRATTMQFQTIGGAQPVADAGLQD